MLRRFAIGFLFIIAALSGVLLAACGTVDYDEKFFDRAKVIFELEGGKYLNSRTSVSHYYQLVDGEPCKIFPLEDKKFSEGGVTRDGGYELDGWYRTKTPTGEGDYEYSDKWDFEKDTVTAEGVTLYAKWNEPIFFTFDFVYIDNDGNEVTVSSNRVNAGNKFGDVYKNDVLSYADVRDGYTAIAVYYDAEHTQPFDDSRPHRGGDSSFAEKLYVEYIEGSYRLVKTADDLKGLGSKGVYLLDNIDMQGKKFSFDNFTGKTLLGNGYRIYNFTVDYSDSRFDLVDDFETDNKKALCISIFGKADGATIKDVTFDNITVVVDTFYSAIDKIYVAPLAVSAKDSTFVNVKVTGTFAYTAQTANAFDIVTDLVFVTDKGAYKYENSTEEGCEYEITLLGEIKK